MDSDIKHLTDPLTHTDHDLNANFILFLKSFIEKNVKGHFNSPFVSYSSPNNTNSNAMSSIK